MELTTIISWLASVFGVLMSISWFAQAKRIWKRKSAQDVSMLFLSIFAVGNLIWLVYGLFIQDIPIILSFAVGLLGVITVFFLALKYR